MSGEEVETEVVDVRMVHQIKKDPTEQFTVTTNLELKMVGSKQEEIDKLKEQLKKMEEDKVTMEGQMEALVGFIHFVHKEVAKLVKYFVTLSKKNLEVANVLNLGPFEDEKELETFLQLLQTLGKQFEGRFEWLGETKGLLKRVNGILEMAAGVMETNGSVDEVEVGGGDQVDQEEDYMESSDFEEESVAAYQMDSLQEPSSSVSPVATASASQSGTPKNRKLVQKKLKRAQMPHGIDLSNHTGFFCLCKKSFPNRTKRSLHIRYYTAKSSFQCPECPKRFKFMTILRAHLKRNHDAKITVPYGETNCYKCGETFSSRKEFFDHLKAEHGGRKRNHSLEERRFKLPSTCPTASTSKKASNQSTHPKTSVDYDGPHGIDKTSSHVRCLCGKTYKHKKELRQHINARKYGKLFKCYICPRPRGFYFLRSLKLHLKTTHKMKYLGGRYGCHICGDTFMQQGDLQVHKKKVHQVRRKATKKPKQHDYGYQRVYTNKRKPVPESPSDYSEALEDESVEQDEVDGILRPPQPEHISVPDNSEAPEDESVEDDEPEPPQLYPVYPEEDEDDDYEVAIQNVATSDLENDNGYDSDVICLN